jgi:hypothetical protein
VEAVAGQLLRSDILAKVASLCALCNQTSDERSELLVRAGGVLALVKADGPFAPLMPLADEGVGFKHRFESLGCRASSVSYLGQVGEMH